MTKIATSIRQIAGIHLVDKVRTFDAEVNSVDVANRMCNVTTIGGTASNTFDARLMASVGDGCLYSPKVGSTVIVTMSEFVEPYISLVSDIASIVWLGGDYDYVPVVVNPNDHTKGLLAKINNLENLVNTILQTLQSTTIPLAPSGSYPFAPLYASVNSITPITSQTDISHDKIKH